MKKSRFSLTLGLLAMLVLLVGAGCASSGAGGAAPAAPVPPPPPPPPAAVGSWHVTIETPVGNQEATLVVSGTAEKLEGKMTGQQGETPLRDVAFDGSKLTFGMTIDAQGQQMDLSFEGAIDGDNLTGNFQSPFGPAPAKGSRIPG